MDLNAIFFTYLNAFIPFVVIALILTIGVKKLKKYFKEDPIATIADFIVFIPIAMYFSK